MRFNCSAYQIYKSLGKKRHQRQKESPDVKVSGKSFFLDKYL